MMQFLSRAPSSAGPAARARASASARGALSRMQRALAAHPPAATSATAATPCRPMLLQQQVRGMASRKRGPVEVASRPLSAQFDHDEEGDDAVAEDFDEEEDLEDGEVDVAQLSPAQQMRQRAAQQAAAKASLAARLQRADRISAGQAEEVEEFDEDAQAAIEAEIFNEAEVDEDGNPIEAEAGEEAEVEFDEDGEPIEAKETGEVEVDEDGEPAVPSAAKKNLFREMYGEGEDPEKEERNSQPDHEDEFDEDKEEPDQEDQNEDPDNEEGVELKRPLRAHPKRRRGPTEDFPGFIVSVHSNVDPMIARWNRLNAYEMAPDGAELRADEESTDEFKEQAAADEREEDDLESKNDPIADMDEFAPTYAQAHDPHNGWYDRKAHEPEEELVEVIHWYDPMRLKMCSFVVDGDVSPPPFWPPARRPADDEDEQQQEEDDAPAEEAKEGEEATPRENGRYFKSNLVYPEGRVWLTWKRSWEHLRKYGLEPGQEEIDLYLTEILGIPKPANVPVLPAWKYAQFEEIDPVSNDQLLPRRPRVDELPSEAAEILSILDTQDQIAEQQAKDAGEEFTSLVDEDGEDIVPVAPFTGKVTPQRYASLATMPWQVLKTEAAWQKYIKQGQQPHTMYEEARRQYKRKVHLVRVKYLAEYRRVKALHDANIQARWDQQKQNRAEKEAHKAARRVVLVERQARLYDMWAARRERIRNKSRFTRQNKEMKHRRHAIHMFNYILKEREHHWIQPKAVPAKTTTGELVAGGATTLVHSANLTTALFEKQETVMGFWPKPSEADLQDRREESARRRAIKEQA